MTSLTLHFDDFEEDFMVKYPLPYLEAYGVKKVLYDAVHKAATHRMIVVVIGEKGLGKTESLKRAREWFIRREALRAEVDHSYAPQHMLIRKSSRADDYGDTLIALSLEIDPRAPIKDRGRSKAASQLLEQNALLLTKKRYAVIALDEGELLRKQTIDAYRDVVAHAGDFSGAGGGVGLVIVGTPACEATMLKQEEMGHRVIEIMRVPMVTIEEAYGAYVSWLPQAALLDGDAAAAFRHVVRVNVCKDRSTHMRRLSGIVREYARRLQMARRLQNAGGWDDVPIDLKLLAKAADSYADDYRPPTGKGPGGARG